jgi:prevent-host-death family protein
MTITTLTSREFNQDASKAKHAAQAGPVIITDRGRPAHVLLTFADYKKLTSQRAQIADLLAMPGAEDIELPVPRMTGVAQSADLRG